MSSCIQHDHNMTTYMNVFFRRLDSSIYEYCSYLTVWYILLNSKYF